MPRDFEVGDNPFALTPEEIKSLEPNYKKPKNKRRSKSGMLGSNSLDLSFEEADVTKQNRLYYAQTESSRWKKRALENVYDLFSDLESDEEEKAEDEGGGADDGDDPTFELANVRRFIIGKESVSKFVENSRKMFLLRYSLTVKRTEKKRLETELREEEMALQRMESELRLAEQAFDQFLQENDRKAIAAMKSAELETRLRLEKALALKQVDNRIIALKRDINKLKDILVEYGTYERFLHSMSPAAWRQLAEEQEQKSSGIGILKKVLMSSKKPRSEFATVSSTTSKSKSRWVGSAVTVSSTSSKSPKASVSEFDDISKDSASVSSGKQLSEIMKSHLDMSDKQFEKNKAVPKLYFQHPQQLLSIFTDLEDENLKLIQECREEEGNLEKIRTSVRETRTRLNQQAANFEQEIEKVTEKIQKEKKAEAKLIQQQEEHANVEETAAEAKRAGEDRILRELGRIVRVTYAECLGPLDQEVTTMDLLKRIELRMEFLTQNLERLPLEKVKIAQRTCERERRQRENEAKMERQRQIEADRNKKALDRALAPPFIRKELRMLMPLESEASFENFMKRRKHGKKNGARRGRGGDDSDESDE